MIPNIIMQDACWLGIRNDPQQASLYVLSAPDPVKRALVVFTTEYFARRNTRADSMSLTKLTPLQLRQLLAASHALEKHEIFHIALNPDDVGATFVLISDYLATRNPGIRVRS